MSDVQRVDLFNQVLAHWREPGFHLIDCAKVVPDTENRARTGLSVEHAHYLASTITLHGFKPRSANGEGHDLPLVVRETVNDEATSLGMESLNKWISQLKHEHKFAPLGFTPR